jgi:hypothetical protein
VPEPAARKRDALTPLFAAIVCYGLFRVVLFFLAPFIYYFGGDMMGITLPLLLSAGISSALAMAVFEGRPLADVGLHWREGSGRNLITGFGLGAGAIALLVATGVAAGMAHYQPVPNADISLRATLFMPILLLCGAMGEEIAFRGFVLQCLMRGWRYWIAIVTTGVLFGWLHNDNPGATVLSDVNTAAFGVLFGAAVVRSRDLWLPIGMHFGWNIALPFLGAAVSGLTIRVTGYELVWTTGDLWSGGQYGPEGSVLTSAMLALLFIAVWKVPVRRGWLYLLDGAGDADLPAA